MSRFLTAQLSHVELPHNENTALYLGNPSGAKKSRSLRENYLIEKKQYALSYNNTRHIPNWVAWHLCANDMGQTKRSATFSEEQNLPFGWYRVSRNDFQYAQYGFERGHLCPSADRTSTSEDNSATFTMSNVVPQSPANNSTVWNDLEQHARRLALRGNELYIIAGTYGIGGSTKNGTYDFIAVPRSNVHIAVPAYLWKVIIAIPEGANDLERITAQSTAIAVLTPNTHNCATSWRDYAVSIDYLEKLTGYDFFALLPDDIEDALESKAAGK